MKHILIVDDSKTNLIMARQELKEDYEVTPVISGEQAIHFLEKRIPDLILLDIAMPVMDGKETLKKIKSNPEWSSIPVIFLTSDESPETEAECLRLGAEDYIRKPFVSKVMKTRIERVISVHSTAKNMIDGIINNGRADRVKDAEEKRPSVLEQLKAEPPQIDHPGRIRRPEERNIG